MLLLFFDIEGLGLWGCGKAKTIIEGRVLQKHELIAIGKALCLMDGPKIVLGKGFKMGFGGF